MLIQLQIENVAIIEKLNITFQEGFNVMTGETGAGKSILIDSLSALLGSRTSRELIRSGAEKATVEGLFSFNSKQRNLTSLNELLESFGIEPQEDESLIISRTFNEKGKNICRVNGKLATVSILKEIGQRLVDIHGQHHNQSLLRPETHIELLDLLSDSKLADEKNKYCQELETLRELKSKLKSLSGEGKERERTIDTLSFQIDEIEKAKLSVGEDEELMRKSEIFSHAEDIISAFSSSYELLRGDDGENESVLDKLGLSLDSLHKIRGLDSNYDLICATLEEVQDKLTDVSREVRIVRDSMEYDPNLHKNIEERISLTQGLKRKYGETIEDILIFSESAKERLDEIERSEELILAIRKEIEETEQSLHMRCKVLNKLRNDAAALLESKISKELAELEMPKTQFKVSIVSCPEDGFNNDGTDRVEFLFSSNPGEAVKSLSRIASGGEMSRVMLAIKSILADIDEIPTMVFDEIDSGVSGKSVSKVGEKLKAVSENHQVICITHHAQIASLADSHYLINKKEQSGRTLTQVKLLEMSDQENEITRLLSGVHVTDAAKKLARELLDDSGKATDK